MSGAHALMTPRRPRPELRLDVWGALLATLAAWVAYLVARSTHAPPSPGYTTVPFTVAPAGAAVAAVVLGARAHAEGDKALGWVASGVCVSFLAMVLQLVAIPEVSADGGPFGTDAGGLALLYLLFHWSLLLGAMAGTMRVPPRWRPLAITAGALIVLAPALDLIPMPLLLLDEHRSTRLMTNLEYLTAGVALAAMLVWVLRSGRSAPALHAWVAVALALNAYDALLNAVAGHRHDEQWWASLSMWVATYSVLAVAAVVTVLIQLRRHEQYAEAELGRREGELMASLLASSQLLASAEALTGAVTAADVARVVVGAASAATDTPRGSVGLHDGSTGLVHVLASVGVDEESLARLRAIEPGGRLPGPYVLRTGRAAYTTSRPQTRRMFPDLVSLPAFRRTAAVAAFPLRLVTGRVGILVVSDDRERDWPPHERQVLAGIADQAAQALQRAHLFEREQATVEVLQRGMLPREVLGAPGVTVAARYLPGAQGVTVGGDWYDSIPLPDGRNVLVVGDVMGKGARAAAVMGRARTAVRTLATLNPRPSAVLEGLDRISTELTADGFITVIYVLLDPGAGVAEVARAGHLPLLLAPPDGAARLVEAGGSPAIGLPADIRPSAQVAVPPGSTLALFTDGLAEDRTSGIDLGLRGLVEACFAHGEATLDELADRLLAQAGGAGAYDDVCLLLARLDPQRPAGSAVAPDQAQTGG